MTTIIIELTALEKSNLAAACDKYRNNPSAAFERAVLEDRSQARYDSIAAQLGLPPCGPRLAFPPSPPPTKSAPPYPPSTPPVVTAGNDPAVTVNVDPQLFWAANYWRTAGTPEQQAKWYQVWNGYSGGVINDMNGGAGGFPANGAGRGIAEYVQQPGANKSAAFLVQAAINRLPEAVDQWGFERWWILSYDGHWYDADMNYRLD